MVRQSGVLSPQDAIDLEVLIVAVAHACSSVEDRVLCLVAKGSDIALHVCRCDQSVIVLVCIFEVVHNLTALREIIMGYC